MYKVGMHNTIKTHLGLGHSIRSISKLLGLSRNTVRSIARQIDSGQAIPLVVSRKKLLTEYTSDIVSLMNKEKSSVLIHEYLVSRYGLQVDYTTVSRFVKSLKKTEVYIPILTPPGQEAQVDFGYIGRFLKEGKMVKVWGFCMVLSYSRKGFYCLVTDQSIATFVRCHALAFEYFCGVPQTVRLDNLKAGVITPNFYEPVYQEEYARFLVYYGSSPIACRPRTPEHKGKVERGIGYLKDNFVKRYDDQNIDYYHLEGKLAVWIEKVCNARKHGTTRKIPAEVFDIEERSTLIQLPALRYNYPLIELRKVDSYGHIHHLYNFYSVPHYMAGLELVVKICGNILHVFDGQLEVACHGIIEGKGIYVTRDEHKPPYKAKKDLQWYDEKASEIGIDVVDFMQEARKSRPIHWYDYMKGVISLCHSYSHEEINLACKRAVRYNSISYQTVKNILDKKLYLEEQEYHPVITTMGGWGQELSVYDQIL
jgi:transposase